MDGSFAEVLWCKWTLFCVCGRGNSPLYYLFMMIIVLWVMLLSQSQMFWSLFLFFIMVHDIIEPCGCQGGHQALMLWGCYLSLSSGDLTSTSSHLCGSWYLPIFLFRDGSLTLINIASLMDLAILWSSLLTMLKLKISRQRTWPIVLWWPWMGEGALMCSLNLPAKVLPDLPYTPLHSPPCYTYICRSLHFSGGWYLCL